MINNSDLHATRPPCTFITARVHVSSAISGVSREQLLFPTDRENTREHTYSRNERTVGVGGGWGAGGVREEEEEEVAAG